MPAEKADHRLDLIGKVCPYPIKFANLVAESNVVSF
jgi:TusA-related sulfurtransferase